MQVPPPRGRLFAEWGGQPGRQRFSVTASLLSLRTEDGTEVSSLLSRSFYQQQYLRAHCFSTDRKKSVKFPGSPRYRLSTATSQRPRWPSRTDQRIIRARAAPINGSEQDLRKLRLIAARKRPSRQLVRVEGALLEVLVRHAILPTPRVAHRLLSSDEVPIVAGTRHHESEYVDEFSRCTRSDRQQGP